MIVLTGIQYALLHPKVHVKNKCEIIPKKIVISRIMSLEPNGEM